MTIKKIKKNSNKTTCVDHTLERKMNKLSVFRYYNRKLPFINTWSFEYFISKYFF